VPQPTLGEAKGRLGSYYPAPAPASSPAGILMKAAESTASMGPPRDPDLRSLARDRSLATRELHFPNAYYGHNRVLRRYAQLRSERSLKVAIEHGPVIAGDRFWEVDTATRMPIFLCAGPERAAQYREIGGNALEARAIGPLILYARHSQARPPGDRLLFFPSHSTHHVRTRYDFREVEKLLERYRRDWNQITVCVYWRDVLDGHADVYRSLGVECVTAGHMYDSGFLDRLRMIIERCDAVSSIEVGSHVFYSVALGRPVSLEWQEIEYGSGKHKDLVGSRTRSWHGAMERLRSALERGLTDAEVAWVRQLIGVEEHRTSENLRGLLEEAEGLYRRTYRIPERIAHVGRARTPQPVRQAASWLVGRARRN
jgi:hypothetical protein